MGITSRLRIISTVWLPSLAFIMLRYIPSSTTLYRIFIMKIHLILPKGFIYWDCSVIFVSKFICIDYLFIFIMLTHSKNSGIKPTWSWLMIFLICTCIQFASILASVLSRDIGIWFCFCVSFFGFVESNTGFIEEIWTDPSISIF